MPWPALANNVGDFALYDSLLAGCADRVVRGGLLDVSKIPVPDAETVAYTSELRAKSNNPLASIDATTSHREDAIEGFGGLDHGQGALSRRSRQGDDW